MSAQLLCVAFVMLSSKSNKKMGKGVRGAEVEKIEEPCWIYYSTVAISLWREAWVGKFALIFFCLLSVVVRSPAPATLSLLLSQSRSLFSQAQLNRAPVALFLFHIFLTELVPLIASSEYGRAGGQAGKATTAAAYVLLAHTHTQTVTHTHWRGAGLLNNC